MTSSPITAWQIDGVTMETVINFILGGSKITAVVDCSHEIKRRLLLGRKAMTNLDSILKSRNITLPTNVPPWNRSTRYWMLAGQKGATWELESVLFPVGLGDLQGSRLQLP